MAMTCSFLGYDDRVVNPYNITDQLAVRQRYVPSIGDPRGRLVVLPHTPVIILTVVSGASPHPGASSQPCPSFSKTLLSASVKRKTRPTGTFDLDDQVRLALKAVLASWASDSLATASLTSSFSEDALSLAESLSSLRISLASRGLNRVWILTTLLDTKHRYNIGHVQLPGVVNS